MKNILSFAGFAFILFNLFLLHGGMILLVGLMESNRRTLSQQMDDMKVALSAVEV